MKVKVTKKSIRETNRNIIKIGFCELQSMLGNETAFAYSASNDGWDCDYYDIGSVVISTGYRPIGESIDYKTVRKYAVKADKIKHNNTRTQVSRERSLKRLLIKFIEEVTG